jgi:hypothetical protein
MGLHPPGAMKVAFVGNRALNLHDVAGHLLKSLISLPDGTIVLLRRGRQTPPGEFESLTQALCLQLHINFEWCVPDEGGREAVYLRDIEMVAKADAVVAYFPDAAAVFDEKSGTSHVVEKGMDADKPVYAYAPSAEGVDWVGGHEPADSERVRLNL